MRVFGCWSNQHILKNKQKIVYSILASESRKAIKAALYLMTCMVRVGPSVARELLAKFDFSMTVRDQRGGVASLAVRMRMYLRCVALVVVYLGMRPVCGCCCHCGVFR